MVDLDRRQVLRDGRRLGLTPLEARLLARLAQQPGASVPKATLLTEVWGYDARVHSRAVDAAVQRLRGKIEATPAAPRHLLTTWGEGYRLHLPAQAPEDEPDAFFGRVDEQARLEALLGDGPAIIGLIGPSGVGKTRLARRATRRLRPVVCELDEVGDAEGLHAQLGRALGCAPRRCGLAQLVEASRGRLLLLDGVEAALAPVAELVQALGVGPEPTRVLYTSLAPLGLRGERRLELGGLAPEAAVDLLADRADAASWRAAPAVLGHIAEALERHPLALELAAGHARVLSPEAALERLERPSDWLVSSRRDRPERHQSLQRAVRWSLSQLEPGLREDLGRLAVFRGSLDLEAAEQALPGPGALHRLGALRGRGLVLPHPEEAHRFRIFAAVRAEALAALTEPEHAWEAHRRCFVARARARVRPGDSAPDVELLGAFAHDVDNLREAFRRSLPDHAEDAVHLALAAYPLLAWRGPVREARRMLEACLARPELDARVRGHLHHQRGNAGYLCGDNGAAREDAERALAIAETLDDERLRGRAKGLGGILTLLDGRFEQAAPELSAALEHSRRAGDGAFEASVLGNYGTALWLCDAPEASCRAYRESARLHEAHGNPRRAAIMRANLGMHAANDRELGRARGILEAALAEHQRLGDRHNEGVASAHLARLELIEGRYADAEARAGAGLELLSAVGDTNTRLRLWLTRAASRWVRGQLEPAWADLHRAQALRGEAPRCFGDQVLLELLLRLDGGELGDLDEAWASAPPPQSWRRARLLVEIGRGFFALERHRRGGPRPDLRALLDPPPPFALTVEPFADELRRRWR